MSKPIHSHMAPSHWLMSCGVALVCACLAQTPAQAKGTPTKQTTKLSQWLQLGPAPAPLPAFHKEKRGKYTYASFLKSQQLHQASLHPKAGQPQDWFLGQTLTWKTTNGTIPQAKRAAVTYLATYLEADRYLKLSLTLKSHQRLRVYLNGRYIAQKTTCTKRPKAKKGKKSNKQAKKPAKVVSKIPSTKGSSMVIQQLAKLLRQQSNIIRKQAELIARQKGLSRKAASKKKRSKAGTAKGYLQLTPGRHRLVVKVLATPECVRDASVKGSVSTRAAYKLTDTFRSTTGEKERYSIDFLLRRGRVGGSALSPDGTEVLVWLSRRLRSGKREVWLQWHRVKDGKLLYSSRPYAQLGGLRWAPDGKSYAFLSRTRRGTTIWLVDRQTKKIRALRRDIKHFQSYTWSPTGTFFLLNIAHKDKPTKVEKTGAKRLRNMNDRWPWYRTHSHLYSLSVRSGSLVRLTAGKWTIWGPSIRFDGKKALFVRNRADYKDRPFSNNTLYELDLQTLKTTKLLDNLRWLWSFSYSPDGKQVLFRGGPSLFGKLGYHPTFPKKGIEQNQYNGELYIYDIKSQTKTALTHTFGPSVNVPFWHPRDKHIYFTALDKTRVRLYQYDVKDKSFTEIATGVDLVGRVSFARHTSRITYVGVGVAHPHRLYTLDLDNPFPQVIAAPSKKRFKRVMLGAVKPWNTVSKQGTKIKGRVYYPPGFDAKKTYPALVYYYGGTYPTTRGFDGRYPAHLWAAHGYVVYILQPSGALGFGQAFAAKHTAEWGTIVPGEIISSTKAFLKAHPFVNPKRVGCLGASYGGFTTMSVVTKTSLFAAAISHAGISNITSYWGAGYWGFLYSSISAAHKYPWSHKRYFIKQSPLFSAHKVTTPLLLIHGTNDNNVPPAESYQMYTALRILKKPVELITFKREGHWILNYRKRLLWTQTIIAWFDKHLKKQPRWFNTLHGTRRR